MNDLDRYFYNEAIMKEGRRDHINPHLSHRYANKKREKKRICNNKAFIESDLQEKGLMLPPKT